jgi:phosphate transport system substrate-binding protein
MSRKRAGEGYLRFGRQALTALLGAVMVAGLLGHTGPARADRLDEIGQAHLDPALGAYLPTIGLKGKLLVVGSDTMHQLLVRLGAEFKKWHPDVAVSVETEGSAAGFPPFLEWSSAGGGTERPGVSMLLAYSWPLQKEKVQEFIARVGYAPMEVHIALGAVAVYVHETNPVRELTLEQLDAMFGVSRKRGGRADITSWGQLGVTGQWEQKPIHLYGRDRESGTRTLFKREALLDGDYKAGIQEESGANSLVLAVSNDPLGIGYAGVVFRDLTSVRVVPLAEKAGKRAVSPSARTVQEGSYPMNRKLFLYANKAPSQELPPVVREFLEFANSRDGQ